MSATGGTTSVRDFVSVAVAEVGMSVIYAGELENEIGKIASCSNPEYQLPLGKEVIKIDPKYFRPTEVDMLIGDATKCKEKLNWEPTHSIDELVADMMMADLKLFQKEKYLKDGGHDTLNYNE